MVADVAIVKGETPAKDRTWLSFPDGTARREAVHVIHDLPHLVVESVFGLDKGLWGTLAAGGFEPASRAVGRRNGRLRLVTDAPFDDLATENWPAHKTAKAAVNAVVNRWGDGPDTPAGVRARLRKSGPDTAELAGRLTDEQLRVAAAGVRRLYRDWAALPVGGTLRATWPLHDSWLRLLLCPTPHVALERHSAVAGHWQLVHQRVDPIYDSFGAMATTLTSSAAPKGADFSHGGAVLLVRGSQARHPGRLPALLPHALPQSEAKATCTSTWFSPTFSILPHERIHVE